tara:strand:+ start:953 stop:1885 length:933 start_codon:yes stop_codon:yes gene_type:complete
MKAIMYHYVREFSDSHPNFRYLDIENFSKQLDFFEKEYGFMEKKDWDDFVNRKVEDINSFNGKIILTFDDAMKCHYEYVYPELEKRGLWGIFYVNSSPYKLNKILDVHRIHLLCGAFLGQDLYKTLLEVIEDKMVSSHMKEYFMNKIYISQNNDEGVSDFKSVLNYYMDDKFREYIIDRIADKFNYTFHNNDFYVSPEELSIMSKSGHVIGSHSVNHPVMSKLSKSNQTEEIQQSFGFLNEQNILTHKTFCHPYGGFHSFNNDTIDILRNEKVEYSFNVESRDIDQNDLIENPHCLPRYDCNEFMHGKTS